MQNELMRKGNIDVVIYQLTHSDSIGKYYSYNQFQTAVHDAVLVRNTSLISERMEQPGRMRRTPLKRLFEKFVKVQYMVGSYDLVPDCIDWNIFLLVLGTSISNV
jgi:hypothetical protein